MLVRRPEPWIAVIAKAVAVDARVVRDVARRLLEVRGEPRPLQDLREQVRRPFARDVRAAELRHRVVAVAEEDALVELGRALPLGALDERHLRHRVGELVEEEAAQRARIAGVAREERALHRLRQVDEAEDRAIEVREVRSEALALLVRERLDREWQAFHCGHGSANASAGLGRNVRLVVSDLAARASIRPGSIRRGSSAFYAERFPTVELNTTGYRMPGVEQFRRWAEQAPDGFEFAPKLPGHRTGALETFDAGARALGDRLGPVRVSLKSTRDEGLDRARPRLARPRACASRSISSIRRGTGSRSGSPSTAPFA